MTAAAETEADGQEWEWDHGGIIRREDFGMGIDFLALP